VGLIGQPSPVRPAGPRRPSPIGSLDIVLYIGSWRAMVAYVRDGVREEVLNEAAVPRREDLMVRYLTPEFFSPIVSFQVS
jgi:hypothetical protein